MQKDLNPSGCETPSAIDLKSAFSQLSKPQRERIVGNYDIQSLAKVFGNEGAMNMIETFFKNDMNISLTARALYMHRNTLIYKLNAIKKLTGFDLKKFDMAVTFKILHTIYMLK